MQATVEFAKQTSRGTTKWWKEPPSTKDTSSNMARNQILVVALSLSRLHTSLRSVASLLRKHCGDSSLPEGAFFKKPFLLLFFCSHRQSPLLNRATIARFSLCTIKIGLPVGSPILAFTDRKTEFSRYENPWRYNRRSRNGCRWSPARSRAWFPTNA